MEGSSSGTSRRSWPKDQFTDLVLSWSLEEIFDENLYKYQVEKIAESFEHVDQYLGSYVFPLLEETRAKLASALETETVYKAPFAEVISFSESKIDTCLYDVKVDHWKNRISDRGTEPYKTLPCDMVLLSDLKPEPASDLQRAGWTFTLACVRNIGSLSKRKKKKRNFGRDDGRDDDNLTFKLKTAKYIDVENGEKKPLYVVFLMNMTTNKRIWKALHLRQNLKIIQKVLSKNDLDEERCQFCSLKYNKKVEKKLEPLLLSKLNESQSKAIFASLSKIDCHHRSSVELIWGPPGTGKTTTLSILLYTLLRMNVRTLVCAPTNVSITELASRVTSLVRKYSVKTESENSFFCHPLGEILIFGNKDRLKVDSDIEEIFFDYRVDSLIDCLVPLTGWKDCVASMLDFLEDCVSHHKIYIENELIKAKATEIQEFDSKSFLEFARDWFPRLATPLRECMLALSTHLPRNFICEENFQRIVELMSLLESIEISLLDNISMTSEELENIFLQKGTIGSELFADMSPLVYTRSRCISILRSLRNALDKLGLPLGTDVTSVEKLCFQKPSLVFCTTSSSFKLNSVDIEPFNFLVIDEAAQVKESESVIALQIPYVRHAILVGDECQLPALVNSKLSEEAGFGRSLFERLSSLGHSKHLLNVQYRMHPSISQFPNLNFYFNQILDAPSVQNLSYERCYLRGRMFGPYSFINIRGGKEELDDVGHSRRNMVEVAVTLKLVQKLFKAWNDSKEKLTIGLISPYAAQVAAIREKVQHKYENIEGFIVKVKSVDGFQGGEEDIIIISTVRSNNGGSIGFLSSPQRTNVALTRARHCLWILGHEGTLSKSDSVWEALIRDAKHRQCLFNADDDPDIRKTIIDAKKELQDLEDLLSGESVLFQNLRWKVLFSDNFRKSFPKLKPPNVKKLVINALLKLASGWRPKKINVEWTCESCSYVVKQFKVEKYYVVCSTDIIKDSIYQQVLKVWDILPTAETPKLLKRLDNIFSMYTDDFINHCNEKLLEGNLEVPKSWSISNVITRFKNLNDNKASISGSSPCAVDGRSYVENSKVSESFLLMKFYTLSAGVVNHLLSDHDGREVNLPFEVSDEEREMIMFPRSSFILGRSGTGKTTILTMKLIRTLQQYSIANNSVHISNKGDSWVGALHQLFVTVSPKLCYAVKNHVSQLKSFASGDISGDNNFFDMDDIDEMTEFKHIPDTFIGIQPEKYPLIITFHKFLMMLDGTLGNSYFERFRDTRDSSQQEGGKRSVALQTFIRKNEVTYDRFGSLYWPHFNAKLTKNLDPSRVFTEIMSHIKGGQQEGDNKRSRLEYISLFESRVSTLSAELREVIYDIFEDYEKMKIKRGEFDIADFVMDIHLRLKNETLSGDKMDFVYIDEVQDLTMKQISLFRYICKNVDEGFIFSGDTAQTIARGIDFRFEDIRSLFYTEFVMKSRKDCEETSRGRRKEKGLISNVFSLSQNFRTHAGVLRLAQSVIDLICHFFPQSIDVLAPETSLIYGEAPVLLEPGNNENSIATIFGHSGKDGRKWVGFGADQVIIVRDDFARKKISNYIGHQALVLTIVECKGLEFQDVLLYNFFGSSPMSSQWRVVYDLLDANCPKSFPSFSQSRHNILCSELKQLYVAITRTRQRLWICENNEELSKPMFDFWRRLCLVQVRKLDDSLAEAMQRASGPEEWKSQGIKLFWEKNYEMATMCFEKAGDEIWEKMAKASGLRAAADSLRGSNSEEAHIMLREAAEIFESIGRADTAAECFCDLGEYERAGRIYLEKCGTSELRKAGECFCLAKSYKTAAKVYDKGNFFKECLLCCTKGNIFDLGLQYIEHWKQQASRDRETRIRCKEINTIAQEFLEKCALECHRRKDNASLMKFVRAFPSIESKRNFLKNLDCLEELLVLEEESGNFTEAAEIAKRLGDVLLEVDLLEKAGNLPNASLLILSYVLSSSLWMDGGQGWPLKSFAQKEQLLKKVVSLAEKDNAAFYASISVQAKLLSHEKMNVSELIQCYNASKKHENRVCEILSVRKILDSHFQVNPTKYDEWEPELYGERILRNRVSGGTLFSVWNLWKVQCLEILQCLESLESVDFAKCEGIVRFCLDYFGVRLPHGLSASFLLMNPNAAWVRNVDERLLMKNRNIGTLESRHFVPAAKQYWHKELICAGLRVLETLESLYKCLLMKPFSESGQSICLICIFDVAKFFIDAKSLEIKNADLIKLNDFRRLSAKYFEIVFPLDPRHSLSENIIYLRETEASKNLLEETISRNLLTRNEQDLTYGQIGRIVMIMMGSAKPKHDLFQKFAQLVCETSYWKCFIEDINGIMLHKALEETYSTVNYRMVKDYISPKCFFYLVERLLILVPHSKGFFFTTKSSFVEYLVSLRGDANATAGLVIDKKPSPARSTIFDSLVSIVRQCICDCQATAEWIRMSHIDCDYYLPLLLLRLFVILCLLCLNSGVSFSIVSELLNLPHVKSQLPREFVEAIRRVKKKDLAAVAVAFKVIGDPLVIVASSGNVVPMFDCPDAVFLDLGLFSCKNEVMKMLFPPIVRNVTKSSKVAPTSDSDKLQINWSLIREMSKATEFVSNSNDGNLKSLFLSKMVEVEEHLNFVTAALGKLEQTAEDNSALCESPSMIEELNQLCSSLDKREFDFKALWEIGEHLRRLEARRPQLRDMSDTMNECVVVSGGTDDKKISNSNCPTEDGKIEDSAVVVNNVSKNAAQEE